MKWWRVVVYDCRLYSINATTPEKAYKKVEWLVKRGEL